MAQLRQGRRGAVGEEGEGREGVRLAVACSQRVRGAVAVTTTTSETRRTGAGMDARGRQAEKKSESICALEQMGMRKGKGGEALSPRIELGMRVGGR